MVSPAWLRRPLHFFKYLWSHGAILLWRVSVTRHVLGYVGCVHDVFALTPSNAAPGTLLRRSVKSSDASHESSEDSDQWARCVVVSPAWLRRPLHFFKYLWSHGAILLWRVSVTRHVLGYVGCVHDVFALTPFKRSTGHAT